jgi:GT2 family glycosyltransferase
VLHYHVPSPAVPPVTICVLVYGPYAELARRTIDSIRTYCARDQYHLVVGANAVGAETRNYLDQLEAEGATDRLIVSESNLNKCPMMVRMFEHIETEFIWWFDDDSYVTDPIALSERLRVARCSPPHHVMWGHVFFFGNETDFSYGTDVVGYVKRAPWFRGKEPPSWAPGGKGEFGFDGGSTGDGRWFFPTGGCWFIRTQAIRALGWPDPGLVKRNDDVFLAEAIRQQGWEFHDIGPCGVAINMEPRRGEGEDKATMERQMSTR